MEVMVQSPTLDNFNNNKSGSMSSPYLSPPSSPKRLGEFYLSAPSSPSRILLSVDYFISETNTKISNNGSVLGAVDDEDDDSFAFFVSHETEESSRSAEELFDGGKIKPLQGKTHHHVIEEENNRVFKDYSPPKKKKNELSQESEHRRGRDRTPTSSSMFSSSNSNRRVTRSHSPYRTPQWEEQEQEHQQQQQEPLSNKEASILTSSNASRGSSSSSKRWRLRDLLLFRSASEGRGSTKDQFKSILYNSKKHEEVTKTSSFRSIDSSSFRRKGHVSAHELHYAMKRAESEDMKKRTFLPYKQGILGRLSGFGI